METISEAEHLRIELQKRHVEHVEAELRLIATFMEMSDVEHKCGEVEMQRGA